jgi:hypothetical protein
MFVADMFCGRAFVAENRGVETRAQPCVLNLGYFRYRHCLQRLYLDEF